MFSCALQLRFVKRCRAITEEIEEETLSVEGEFMTEADMNAESFSETFSCKNDALCEM